MSFSLLIASLVGSITGILCLIHYGKKIERDTWGYNYGYKHRKEDE